MTFFKKTFTTISGLGENKMDGAFKAMEAAGEAMAKAGDEMLKAFNDAEPDIDWHAKYCELVDKYEKVVTDKGALVDQVIALKDELYKLKQSGGGSNGA